MSGVSVTVSIRGMVGVIRAVAVGVTPVGIAVIVMRTMTVVIAVIIVVAVIVMMGRSVLSGVLIHGEGCRGRRRL